MAKIQISREEITKMLQDQLEVKEVIWDKNGNAKVELDLNKIKKKEKECCHYYYTYPTYISSSPTIPKKPYWTYTNKSNSLTYTSTLL